VRSRAKRREGYPTSYPHYHVHMRRLRDDGARMPRQSRPISLRTLSRLLPFAVAALAIAVALYLLSGWLPKAAAAWPWTAAVYSSRQQNCRGGCMSRPLQCQGLDSPAPQPRDKAWR
jgi:hypothetical protein